MNKLPIPDASGFKVDAEVRASFEGPPQFFELSGPGSLVRLVQFKKITYDGLRLSQSPRHGRYWFDEQWFVQVRNEARRELLRQQTESGRSFVAPFSALVGHYMRHVLRGDLAVAKDWTNDFDAYVRLRLQAGDRFVALVGPVARQPAYSPAHPQHQAVVENDVYLACEATQYVIDFNHPPNRAYVARIQGPFEF